LVQDIQICIALAEVNNYNFNNIIREIIKKSLFTERQIEIILNQKNLLETKFNISKGAYFRQVSQSRNKIIAFYYTVVLLRGLGILLPDDIDVMYRLSDQVSVIQGGDVFPEREQQIIDVIDKAIRQASDL
jgi:hypothetical protein